MKAVIGGITVVAAVAGAVVRFSASTEVFPILFSKKIERVTEVGALLPLLRALMILRGRMVDQAGTEEECMSREIRQSETAYSLAMAPVMVEVQILGLR
jgi:hypothetical protein